MKQRYTIPLLFALLLLFLVSCTCQTVKDDSLYQVSTIQALMDGVYDSSITIGEVRRYGDFGLGTLYGLDGELIVLDGVAYQVHYSGKVYKVPDDSATPFALVKFFNADIVYEINEPMTLSQMEKKIASLLPSNNYFYAVRIDGTFKYVKTRSVQRQQRPYKRLIDAVKNQSTFEFEDIRGTVVGLWIPEYFSEINVPGFHMHFIDNSRTMGGHLLDLTVHNARVMIDTSLSIRLMLISNRDFQILNLKGNNADELYMIEKKPKKD